MSGRSEGVEDVLRSEREVTEVVSVKTWGVILEASCWWSGWEKKKNPFGCGPDSGLKTWFFFTWVLPSFPPMEVWRLSSPTWLSGCRGWYSSFLSADLRVRITPKPNYNPHIGSPTIGPEGGMGGTKSASLYTSNSSLSLMYHDHQPTDTDSISTRGHETWGWEDERSRRRRRRRRGDHIMKRRDDDHHVWSTDGKEQKRSDSSIIIELQTVGRQNTTRHDLILLFSPSSLLLMFVQRAVDPNNDMSNHSIFWNNFSLFTFASLEEKKLCRKSSSEEKWMTKHATKGWKQVVPKELFIQENAFSLSWKNMWENVMSTSQAHFLNFKSWWCPSWQTYYHLHPSLLPFFSHIILINGYF